MLKRFFWVVPVLAGLLAFAMAIRGELVWDDQVVVKQQLMAFDNLADVFNPPPGIPKWSSAYYRPVIVLTYLADSRLFGVRSVAGAHASNIAFHLATTLLVWLLLRRVLTHLPKGAIGAMIGATLFAVHPIHTESVSWMTGRSDLVATCLLLPAILLALRWWDRASIWALVLSPVFFVAALLAKEVAIAGFLIVPVVLLMASPGGAAPRGASPAGASPTGQSPNGSSAARSRLAGRWVPLAAVLVSWLAALWLYWLLRSAAGVGTGTGPPISGEAWLRPLEAAGWYVWKLLIPWPQSNYIVWEMLPGPAIGIALLAVATALFVVSVRQAMRDPDQRTPAAGLWWIGVALAPSLAVTLTDVSETPVAERYLYLPSVGLALVAGAVVATLAATKWARATFVGSALLVAAYLAGTIQRGMVWQTDLGLWTDTTRKVPGYGLPWLELGKARRLAGDVPGAIEALQTARIGRNSALTGAVINYNLGALYAERGDRLAAEQSFRASLAADQSYAGAHYGLGRLIYERVIGADRDAPIAERLLLLNEAASRLSTAVRLNPLYVNAYSELARVRLAEGDLRAMTNDPLLTLASYEDAVRQLDNVRRLDPATAARADLLDLRQRLESRLQ